MSKLERLNLGLLMAWLGIWIINYIAFSKEGSLSNVILVAVGFAGFLFSLHRFIFKSEA